MIFPANAAGFIYPDPFHGSSSLFRVKDKGDVTNDQPSTQIHDYLHRKERYSWSANYRS
ncbi:MAG: hypothetical protein ABWY16_14800 [Pedobacter sp.]|uniref:hypothetical protein n=1 Tax=Pedobacter sp. TaxID=1411316 RepID=UPI0033976856